MVNQVSLIDKKLHQEIRVDAGKSNTVQLAQQNPAVIKVQLSKSEIKDFLREGGNLKIILNNGETITIFGFFAADNSLVLQDNNNDLLWVDFIANGEALSATYSSINDIEPLLYSDGNASPLAWAAIPLTAGGILAWAGHNSSKDSDTGGTGETGVTGETGGTGGTGGLDEIGATGATGGTGSTGATGETGSTGETGATGADGKSALELLIEAGELPPGSDINDLIDYLKGADGVDGATGATGADGKSALELLIDAGELPPGSDINDLIDYLKGADGVDGATGATGADGKSALELLIDAGELPPGSDINDLIDYLKGADGVDGATGVTGATGATGATGGTGSAGADGTNGVDGATGVTGATGETGSAGADGTDGVDGATGVTGATGATGETGSAGADGTDGVDGATGVTGATGETGSAGADGTDGVDGATGVAGATGATGATGGTGSAGADGTDGVDGATGVTGATGETGSAGADGTDGVDGATGATGASGSANLIESITLNSDADSNGKLSQGELRDAPNTVTIALGADAKEDDTIVVNGTPHILTQQDVDAQLITVPVPVVDGLNFIRVDAFNPEGQTDIDFKFFEVLDGKYIGDVNVVSDTNGNNIIDNSELSAAGGTIDVRVQLGPDVRVGDVVTLDGINHTVITADIGNGYVDFNDVPVTQGQKEILDVEITTGTGAPLDSISKDIQIDGAARNIVESIAFPKDVDVNGTLNASEMNGKNYTAIKVILGADAKLGDIVVVNGDKYVLGSTEINSGALSVNVAVREGQNPIEVTSTDEWGNVDHISDSIIVDALPPESPTLAPIAIDDIPLHIGNITNNSVTNDNRPEITGEGRVEGEIITLYVNNVAVTGVGIPITVQANGKWSYTPSLGWSDNNYVITYTVSDSNGNVSVKSPPLNFEIDTAAPTGGLVSIDTPIAGNDVVDASEASTDIIVTGTVTIPLDAVTTVITVTVNGESYQADVTGSTWTVDIPGSQFADGEGSVNVEAVFTDAAGNTSVPTVDDAVYTLDIPAVLNDSVLAGVGVNPPVTGSTVKTGTSLGMDSITAQVTVVDGSGTLVPLTVDGVALVWSGTGTVADPFIATATGFTEPVLSITINNNGDYTIVQNHSLDHHLVGADKITITIPVLDGGLAHDVLKLEIVDGVPVAAADNAVDLTQQVTQGLETLDISIPQTYRGSAVETFGGDTDGAHVSKVTIEGVDFTYDGATVTTPNGFGNSGVVASHTVVDGSDTSLVVTTARGETITVNLDTGNYTVEVTGQGLAANETPEANIAGNGGLLGGGIINADALGVIDLSQTQTFSVSDANENLTKVNVVYETSNLTSALDVLVTQQLDSVVDGLRNIPLGVGNLLANLIEGLGVKQLVDVLITNPNSLLGALTRPLVKPLTDLLNEVLNGKLVLDYDAQLATELGLKVTAVAGDYNNNFKANLVIESLTSNGIVDSLAVNQLLGTVKATDSDGGLLDLLDSNLNLLTSLELQAFDQDGAASPLESQDLTIQLGLISGGIQSNTTVIKDNGFNLDQTNAAQSVQIFGLDGNDIITGSNFADIIRGGTGTDTINGGAGNDIIIAGKGNDTLTGGLGRDIFKWESGDQGSVATPARDTITDFDIRSVAQGGDVLDLSSLLPNADRVGTNSVNIGDYVSFIEVSGHTEIHISTTGNLASGVDQIIVLDDVTGFVGEFASQDDLISYLLKSGKLVIGEQVLDQVTYDAIKADDELNIDIEVKDGDGDTDIHNVDLIVGSLDDANQYQSNFDPNNIAPEVGVDMTEVLGLIGIDALGLLDLSRQAYSVIDINNNLQYVELTYQPVVNVGLTRAYYEVSAELAAELGLKVQSVTNTGLLNLLGYSNTLIITALDGGTVSNLAINELLAAVQLKSETGTLLTGNLLTADVLNSVSLTAVDSQGASTTVDNGRLLDINLASNFNNGNNFIFEGGTLADVLDHSTATESIRLYGYDGNDILTGGTGNDLLRGGDGNDSLTGGAGNDLLIGGSGDDTFTGGAGNDTALYELLNNLDARGGNGTDTWSDFTLGSGANADKIDVSALLDGQQTAANIGNYISVKTDVDGHAVIAIDRDGSASGFGKDDLLVLNNINSIDLGGTAQDQLQALLNNNQIIF